MKKYCNKNFIYKIIEKDLKNKKCNLVHTRFAPEPNGYLHIGHAKAICLNFGIADFYNGKCNLRFDDTNPDHEQQKYVESIIKDIKWLGFNINKKNIFYASDYFDQLYQYAIKLINKGLAYVDELQGKQIKLYRGTLTTTGENSPYRNRTISENLILFEKMRNGFFNEGQACLRAKIDMNSPIIIMRDPILYRIKHTPHYRKKTKWCVYPTYDFTHCLSDAIEGITHSICTLEFLDNRMLYNWILENINIKNRPYQYEFSRLNITYNVMSKRKMNEIIKQKIIKEWDDPRMITLSGLRRRGYTAHSIKDFCKRIGVTKQDHIVENALLEFCISNELNKNALRFMAILNPIKVIIENLPYNYEEYIDIPNHPKEPHMGKRKFLFSKEIYIDESDFCEKQDEKNKKLKLNQKVRLRYSYIIKAVRIEKNIYGKISCIYCIYYKKNDYIKNNKKEVNGIIHWISSKFAVLAEFRLYENLFFIKDPNKEKKYLSFINKKSLIVKKGLVELNLKHAQLNQSYQFEREGYFCLDKDSFIKKNNLIFNCIKSIKK